MFSFLNCSAVTISEGNLLHASNKVILLDLSEKSISMDTQERISLYL